MTNPPTDERGVTDVMVEIACLAADRASGLDDGSTESLPMRAALKAALSHQGEVVEVAQLEALRRCDLFSEGFHNGSSCIEYDWNPTGDWIRWSDLTALISKAEKV